MTDYNLIVNTQKNYFNSDETKNLSFRINKLKLLYKVIKENEQNIEEALYKDLNKSYFESYETEIGLVLGEIRLLIKKLRKWNKTKRVHTPIMHFPSKSYVYNEPYGVVLIMSPWNYPFQLTMVPLAGAVAAGNCCVVKPSQYSAATSELMEKLLAKVFDKKHVDVIQGGREANTNILKERFDYIFFTGSPAVGHVVMEAAANYLTPVTLELGGKSPCIVDDTANIKLAAKRIIWGKLINAGQTCIAPDYVLVQENVKEKLIDQLKYYINYFYGDDPIHSEKFPKIINEKHFNRLLGLIKNENCIIGGNYDEVLNKIAPTIVDKVTWESPVMNEEIFGPILPILTFNDFNEIQLLLKSKEKPLALYLFTSDKNHEKLIMNNVSFGGGCINDTIIHIANSNMAFGGVGNSGMGHYHGKASFDTFSHKKSVIKKSTLIDINMRYPTLNNHLGFIRKILK